MKRWTWMVLIGAAAGVVMAIISHPYLRTPAKNRNSAEPMVLLVNELRQDFEFDINAKQPSPETLKKMQELAAMKPDGQQAVLPFYDQWLRRMHDHKLSDTPEFRDLNVAVLALDPAAPKRAVAALREKADDPPERDYQTTLVRSYGKAALASLLTALEEDARSAGDNYALAAKSSIPPLLGELGGAALPGLVKALKNQSAPATIRRQALRTIAFMVPEQAADALPDVLLALKDKEASVRAFAALVLAGDVVRKEKATDQALLKALNDEDLLVPLAAARTLTRRDTVDKTNVALVLKALLQSDAFSEPLAKDPKQKRKVWWDVAGLPEFAVWKGAAGSSTSTSTYNSLFWEETAAHVLLDLGPAHRNLGPADIVEMLRRCPHDGRHLGTLLAAQGSRAKEEAVPKLVDMVKDPNPLQRRKALIMLGKLGNPFAIDAVPAIVEAMDHKDGRTRWQAFVALMRIDPDAARKKLPKSLTGAVDAAPRNDLTRVAVWTRNLWHDSAAVLVPVTDENMATDGMGIFRTPTDWDITIENERIDNMLGRLEKMESSAKGVGPLGKGAVPFLLALWESTGRNSVTRARHGNRALALLGREGAAAESALPHLLLALNYYDADDPNRKDLYKAFFDIGDGSLPYLMEVLNNPDKRALHNKVLEVLQYFGPRLQPALPSLVKALAAPDENTAAIAAETFKVFRDSSDDAAKEFTKHASAELVKLLHSANLTDSRNALAAGVGSSLAALVKSETSKSHRHAVDALGYMGPQAKSALPALIELFHDDSQEMRIVARRAVSQIGKDAVEPLTKALEDQRDGVRLNAILALNLMPRDVAIIALPAVQKLAASEQKQDVKNAAETFLKSMN